MSRHKRHHRPAFRQSVPGRLNGPAFAVEVGWQETVTDELQWHGARRGHVGFEEELDCARVRLAIHHLVLLERINADPVPVDQPEVPCREDVRIRPDAVLGVIREEVAAIDVVCLSDESVAIVGACGIAGLRNSDAVVKGQRWIVESARRELTQEPMIGGLVVQHNRVA